MNMSLKIVEPLIERPVDPGTVLTDNQLVAGGMSPVTTWARTDASKGALRSKKAKEKKRNRA